MAEDDRCVYLFVGVTEGYVIPKSAFSSGREAAGFASSARAMWREARSKWDTTNTR